MINKNKCEKWYGTFHEYGKWQVTNKGDVRERSFRDPKQEWVVTGQIILQERVCEICGFTDYKKTILDS